MHLIPYEAIEEALSSGLTDHLCVSVIRGNQTAPSPVYPYGIFNPTTIASANNGTWQEDADGKDRLLVRSIWSLSFLARSEAECAHLALRARNWLTAAGRAWLSERGIVVQSVTDINPRDNILTVEYERKCGFDVVFYVYDEVESLKTSTGTIDEMTLVREN